MTLNPKALHIFLVIGMVTFAFCAPDKDFGTDKPSGKPGKEMKKKGGRGWHGKNHPREDRGELFERLDQDGSGSLTLQEFSAAPKLENLESELQLKMFERLDANNDDRLEPGELNPMESKIPIIELDQDGDRSLNFDEFRVWGRLRGVALDKSQEMFRRLDSDGDGFISRSDFRRGGHKHGPAAFAKADIDSSGDLTREEFGQLHFLSQMPEEHVDRVFRKIDQNSDSVLELREFHLMGKSHKKRHMMHIWARLKASGVLDDGMLSRDELEGVDLDETTENRIFDMFDRNADGLIDKNEFPSGGKREKRKGSRPGKGRERP